MEKKCFDCVYGGCCFPSYNNVVPCKNENVEKKEIQYYSSSYNEEIGKEMVVENNTAETCEYFIPHLEVDDEDIELETVVNVTHRCPYCNEEETEYGVDSSGSELVTCSKCGKKYKISWNYEG